ncbi:MAG: DUF2059 domain-containing protein [Rhodoferax sp.]|jgi:hypothetical protein|nr:DUF2059 domain-containing protein [Rhodoferax sp.]MBP9060513.1 DUF2059 domain-containing protein [Rhodoferax sp.]MBP9685044.1 DUF2059 domain-containing protein [Rhodoferax sp.]
MFKIVAGIVLICVACTASAQSTKNQLIQRLLQLWPLESVGMAMLRRPIDDSLRKAEVVLQGRVAPERRDSALKDISAETQKFYDETVPMVRETSNKLVQSTVVPILAEKFTEAELRQIIAMFEAPVKAKFEAVTPEIQKALGKKIAAEMAPTITPKMEALQQKIGERLKAAATAP